MSEESGLWVTFSSSVVKISTSDSSDSSDVRIPVDQLDRLVSMLNKVQDKIREIKEVPDRNHSWRQDEKRPHA